MFTKTSKEGARAVIEVGGEIDAHTAPQLKRAISEAFEEGTYDLVLDLEQVTFLDSTGLGVVVAALKRARENGGELRIVCTRRGTLRILEVTGLDQIIPLYSAQHEATAS